MNFQQLPLNVSLIKDTAIKNNGYELVSSILRSTPFYLSSCALEAAPQSKSDILILSDLDNAPPLYFTTYLKENINNKAIVVIGPTLDGSECITHIIAGAQDYFNCERLTNSPQGFIRCLRFAYEREKRTWKEQTKS